LTRLGSIASLAFAVHVVGLILWPFAAILPPGQRALCAAAGCVPPWHMVLGYLAPVQPHGKRPAVPQQGNKFRPHPF